MGATTQLASTTLSSGESSAEVTVTPPGDGLVLKMTTTPVTTPCQARLTVRDSQGRNMGSLVCQDGDDKRLTMQGFESGDLTFQVECNLGTVTVLVEELTDLDAVLPESDATLELDDIPDDLIPEAKLADGAKGLGTDNLQAVADPGAMGAIVPPAAGSFRVSLSGALGARTLNDPAYDGQVCVLQGANTNAITVSPETGDFDGTNDIATFGAAADRLVVIGAGVEWRILANVDVVLSTM